MNQSVRVEAIDGHILFDAEEIAPNEWRWTSMDHSGLCRATREHVVNQTANLIAEHDGLRIRFESSAQYQSIAPDRFGNIWRDGNYEAPVTYLPALIT